MTVRWAVFETGHDIHVAPVATESDSGGAGVEDLVDNHALVRGCWCQPRVEERDSPLVVHNLFDN